MEKVKINFKNNRIGKRPKMNILNPKLKRNFNNDKIPHVYPLAVLRVRVLSRI